MPTAALYCRISRDRGGDALGVHRQETDARALCEARGWEVGGVYTDDDTSAYSGKPRPAYRRMLDDLAAGTVDAVVAWHPDRLHRSTRELDDFIDLIERTKATVATCQGGDYDLSTASGRMTARVVGAVARHESEHKSERLKRKAAEIAQAGAPSGGGDRAYGFEDDRVTHRPSEVAVIRKAARRVLDGETLRAIRLDLNARGVATVTGTPWSSTVIRRVLTSARTAGLREHHGVMYPGVWKPIITEAEMRRLRLILLDPGRRTNQNPRRYLLTGGIARCTECKAALVARPKAGGIRCYVCAGDMGGCGKIRRIADTLEDYVGDQLLDAFDAGMLHEPDDGDLTAALVEIEQLEGQLAEAATDYYAERSITRDQFSAVSTTLTARIAAAKAAAARLHRVGVSTPRSGDLRVEWHAAGFDRRRALVARYVERVDVLPAVRGRNFFDVDRVQVVFAS
jgi:site-specific DNA recombinase